MSKKGDIGIRPKQLGSRRLPRGCTLPSGRPLQSRSLVVLFFLLALLFKMMCKNPISVFTSCLGLVNPTWSLDTGNLYSNASPPPWQSVGPNDTASYWFSELQASLETLQTTYWNGTTWPTTIQWIGAFLSTLLSASSRSFVSTLDTNFTSIPTTPYNSALTSANITTYLSQIKTYYASEDTSQIFSAAYDDAQWVVLEWLEALRLLASYESYAQTSQGSEDIARFAHRAHVFYNIVQNQFNTTLCGGGITWNPALAPYKNAITNELFLASSAAMYVYFPGDEDTDPYPSPSYEDQTNVTLPPLTPVRAHDPLFLRNAIAEYEWFTASNFTNAQGLIVDGFHVSPNQTTCDQRNEMVYSYNQGVILSGLRMLWEATGNDTYLADCYSLVDTVINATGWNAATEEAASVWAGLGRNGVMEDYCDAAQNCTQDAQIFKGVYFTHLAQFCEPLPMDAPLVEGVTVVASKALAREHRQRCAGYATWVRHNAYAALSTRNKSGVVGGCWGARLVNQSQSAIASAEYAPMKPKGSWDVVNDPAMLGRAPWVCQGQYECRSRRGGGFVRRERGVSWWKRDANDHGLGRTVETQGSGVGVVRAASDFSGRGR